MSTNFLKGSHVMHPRYGEGIIGKVTLTGYDIFFETGGKIQLSKNNLDLDLLESPDNVVVEQSSVNVDELTQSITTVLDKFGLLPSTLPLGKKWEGGMMLLQPANLALKPKEIPIETFFHKIVMLRDRLRVLEQNINSHAVLTDEEKVQMQQYITKVYGSLTTFNVLFDDTKFFFVGEKKS